MRLLEFVIWVGKCSFTFYNYDKLHPILHSLALVQLCQLKLKPFHFAVFLKSELTINSKLLIKLKECNLIWLMYFISRYWIDYFIHWFCRLVMSSRRKRQSCKKRSRRRWNGPRSLQSLGTNKQRCNAWRGKSIMKAKWTRLGVSNYALIPRRKWSLIIWRTTNNRKWDHISETMYQTQLVQICSLVGCKPLCVLCHTAFPHT